MLEFSIVSEGHQARCLFPREQLQGKTAVEIGPGTKLLNLHNRGLEGACGQNKRHKDDFLRECNSTGSNDLLSNLF